MTQLTADMANPLDAPSRESAATGLSVAQVSFAFGRKEVLRDVSFEVARGRFCALLGPNGAGKSTLFGLLTRLFTTRQGAIHVAGCDLARNPRAALRQIGVVFQQPTLDLDLTVRRNMLYFAALHGLAGPEADRRAKVALERLGMAERAYERAGDLNGGHRRRLEIARALIHRPRVLLLDEPTVGLDAATRHGIVAHVHDLAAEGMTVLWATHLTDEVHATDQLVILHQGRVISDAMAGGLTGSALTERYLALTGATP